MKDTYIYHKTALQLLKYIIEIWEAKSEKEKSNELPIVIPLVIYHGQKDWNIGLSLGEIIQGYEGLTPNIQRLVPNFEYLLYDLSKYKDEDIKGEAQLQIILTTLRDIFTKDSIDLFTTINRAVKYLRELEDHQTGIRYVETLLRYIFSAGRNLTKSEVVDMMKEIETNYPEGRDVVMTIAEQLIEEGKKQGLKQGIEKGIEEGKKQGLKQGIEKV
ncbi:Rpn family recombination-promoting nuclease/putative transposase [Bacillus andreraoultii]|uniref:Rpn family recombination-promoting nuclease/putative transposase n=3 Tax=Bacillus andreraoultii TaxID=1499685 RepID=UPI00096AF739|nr:Rpn family recombination-promoting nuclease/putative transposase [Bacillus andreraoultii]